MKFEELHNDKETNDECLLNTVKESLNKGELCLFMSETGTFMSTGENDDTEETLTVNKVGILYIYTDYDKYRKSNGEAVESSLDIKAFATLEEAETGLFMIKARQYYRNSIKVDDITYAQMKAIFDILGIDTEEVLK